MAFSFWIEQMPQVHHFSAWEITELSLHLPSGKTTRPPWKCPKMCLDFKNSSAPWLGVHNWALRDWLLGFWTCPKIVLLKLKIFKWLIFLNAKNTVDFCMEVASWWWWNILKWISTLNSRSVSSTQTCWFLELWIIWSKFGDRGSNSYVYLSEGIWVAPWFWVYQNRLGVSESPACPLTH